MECTVSSSLIHRVDMTIMSTAWLWTSNMSVHSVYLSQYEGKPTNGKNKLLLDQRRVWLFIDPITILILTFSPHFRATININIRFPVQIACYQSSKILFLFYKRKLAANCLFTSFEAGFKMHDYDGKLAMKRLQKSRYCAYIS